MQIDEECCLCPKLFMVLLCLSSDDQLDYSFPNMDMSDGQFFFTLILLNSHTASTQRDRGLNARCERSIM
jgi:hypothetical protein